MHETGPQSKTLCDAHVHIYDCFELDYLLDNAADNFRNAAHGGGISDYSSVIMLSETSRDHRFAEFEQAASSNRRLTEKWSVSPTPEPIAVKVHRDGAPSMFVVAGRQIVTEEGLEILALATNLEMPDGVPAEYAIAEINDAGGIAVAPWGVGKWWGKRGRTLSSLMSQFTPEELLLGDNGGRPWFMQSLRHFREARIQSRRILPGTDPLPFPREAAKPGRTGFILDNSLDEDAPARHVAQLLRNRNTPVTPYMSLEHTFPFLRNQVGMQLRKHLS